MLQMTSLEKKVQTANFLQPEVYRVQDVREESSNVIFLEASHSDAGFSCLPMSSYKNRPTIAEMDCTAEFR